MKTALTDIAIQKFKYLDKNIIHWDTNLPAFGIRVGKTTKTFVASYGRDRKLETIGCYSQVSLKDARQRARDFLAQPSEVPMGQKRYQVAIIPFIEAIRGRLKKGTVDQYKAYLDAFALDKRSRR